MRSTAIARTCSACALESTASWHRRAAFLLARKLLPGMMARKFGRFVTISSNIAVYGTAFFASDAAEYVTGQSLHVSGGLFMP